MIGDSAGFHYNRCMLSWRCLWPRKISIFWLQSYVCLSAPGALTAKNATEEQPQRDHTLYDDLMRAGIKPKYLPMSQRKQKGMHIAMAVDTLQVGLGRDIDIAILVTGGDDFVRLVRTPNKQGIRVLVAFLAFTPQPG